MSDSNNQREFDGSERTWLWRSGREPPKVHVLTSSVSETLVANVLLALGGEPSLTGEVTAVGSFVAATDALVVNLGMLDPGREAASLRAIEAAQRLRKPWLLDPVKVENSPERAALARSMLSMRPAIVKGNAAEIAALAGAPGETGAAALARRFGCTVVITGRDDLVTDGRQRARITGGSALMTRVTAMGCALGGAIGGQLATGEPAFLAATNALAAFAAAGGLAQAVAYGPGSFVPAFLDTLATMTPGTVAQHAAVIHRPVLDLRLYGLLDPSRCRGRNLAAMAVDAVEGGVTLLQLRDKTGDMRRLMGEAATILEALRGTHVPLLIDDRIDIAVASGAQGAHVGRTDLDPVSARRILGPDALLGATIHHAPEAAAIPDQIASYAGLGPVFQTQSKDPGDPPLGPTGLAGLIKEVRALHPGLPVCGIAGIDRENAATVIRAGADGVAVISDIFMADDVVGAARTLRSIVDEVLARRAP